MTSVKSGESRKDFMKRCIPIVIQEGATSDAAAGKCGGLFSGVKESITCEVQDFKFITKESKDGLKTNSSLRLSGTALATGTSRNKRTYTFSNLEENDGQSFNFIVGHRKDFDNPDHNVGEGLYSQEGNVLRFDGPISNNSHHPDIIESVKKGLISVSIQGGYENKKVEDGKVIVEGLRIPILALVNKHTRGVPAASIEAAIEERMNLDEVEHNKAKEAHKMEDKLKETEKQLSEAQLQLQLKEAQDKLKVSEEKSQKLEADMKTKAKETIVESLVKINKELKKEDLVKESEDALKVRLEYENKAKESEDDKKEEKAEGDGEVKDEDAPKDEKKSEESLKGISYDIDKQTIGFSTEESYKAWNKSLMEKTYK